MTQFIHRGAMAALLLSLAAFSQPAAAQSASVRIGFVNTDRILREAAPAKAAQIKLEQEFSKREKELNAASVALKKASEDFERDSPTLSSSQRQLRQRKLMDQDREFQRRQREFQEDLNARKQEELQQLIERANRVVKQVAESDKYDVILQEAVYISPRLDVTDKVIKALDASK